MIPGRAAMKPCAGLPGWDYDTSRASDRSGWTSPSRSTRARGWTRPSSSTSASGRPSDMRLARQIAKWSLIGGAGLLAVVALGLALGFGWLQSDSGRDWLARQIEDAASTPGEMELSIGALTGDLPQSLVARDRSEEHTSELQSLMRRSYAVFRLKKKKTEGKVAISGEVCNSTSLRQQICVRRT